MFSSNFSCLEFLTGALSICDITKFRSEIRSGCGIIRDIRAILTGNRTSEGVAKGNHIDTRFAASLARVGSNASLAVTWSTGPSARNSGWSLTVTSWEDGGPILGESKLQSW